MKRLTFEVDTEPYAKIRDEEISNLAFSKFGIEVVTKTSHTLFNPNDIVRVSLSVFVSSVSMMRVVALCLLLSMFLFVELKISNWP